MGDGANRVRAGVVGRVVLLALTSFAVLEDIDRREALERRSRHERHV